MLLCHPAVYVRPAVMPCTTTGLQEIKALKVQQKRAPKDLADLRRDVAGDAAAAETRTAALAARVASLEARPSRADVDALAAAAGDQLAALAVQVCDICSICTGS